MAYRRRIKAPVCRNSSHFFPVVMFAITTGLRRSNVTDLEWSQVDLDKKMAWMHPDETKAGNAIGVPLNETACQILKNSRVSIRDGYLSTPNLPTEATEQKQQR